MDESKYNMKTRRGSFIVVEFGGHRLELFNNPWEFPFKRGDSAIVEADRGQEAGLVKCVFSSLNENQSTPEYDVIRRATVQDMLRINTMRKYENQALNTCRQKIRNHELPMKLVDAEYRFDGLKLTFYFTSDGRVDFRELVRDLAGTFRTRIELRQIGARDETKRSDGYGTCGRMLCCVSFIDCFQPITTQMAKVQNLILNPSKLSGRCGRLKCCLAFEYEAYCQEGAMELIAVSGKEEINGEEIDQISD